MQGENILTDCGMDRPAEHGEDILADCGDYKPAQYGEDRPVEDSRAWGRTDSREK